MLVCGFSLKLAQCLFLFVYSNERSVCIIEIARLNSLTTVSFSRRILKHPVSALVSGAFVKLRKATISFVMSLSVLVSSRIEQIGSHWIDFHWLWYLSIFAKSVEKIQDSLRSNKNNKSFTWRPINIFDDDVCTFKIFRSFLLRMENVSEKLCRENQNTNFTLNNFFS